MPYFLIKILNTKDTKKVKYTISKNNKGIKVKVIKLKQSIVDKTVPQLPFEGGQRAYIFNARRKSVP